jgi:RNA polymerase sigma-70 factor (ECF subfamily)
MQPPPPPLSETGWTEKIRAGDHDAFEALFHSHYPSLCSLVARRVESPETAEEIVQDVFLRVWERRHALDPELSITHYLYRAARNHAMNHVKHRSIVLRERDAARTALRPSETAPEDRIRYDEIAAVAQRAIEQLPERCREIFLLSRHGELKYAEIASLLGISIKTVETHMVHALSSLRSGLLPYI